MLNIGWSELLVIATVAIVVVGPKDLPRMLRTFGKTFGQVRRTANDFKRQFNDALREAEREADLQDTRDQLKSIVSTDPLADVKKDFDRSMKDADKKMQSSASGAAGARAPAQDKAGDPAVAGVHEAAPVKTGTSGPAGEGSEAETVGSGGRGTDAA